MSTFNSWVMDEIGRRPLDDWPPMRDMPERSQLPAEIVFMPGPNGWTIEYNGDRITGISDHDAAGVMLDQCTGGFTVAHDDDNGLHFISTVIERYRVAVLREVTK